MEHSAHLFKLIHENERISSGIVRPSVSYWQDAWRRFRRHKPALIAAAILLIIILGAIFIPMIYPYTYDQQIRTARNLWPNYQHPFGTDKLGRDLFIRVVYGARISLSIGIVASIINLTLASFMAASPAISAANSTIS